MNSKLVKSGIALIFIGEGLYLVFSLLKPGEGSAFGDFFSGLLLGISVGINLVGLVLAVIGVARKDSR